jgi:hypothetical protein
VSQSVRSFLAWLLVPLGITAAGSQGPPPLCGFGQTLDQARETGFFKWFMLDQTAETDLNGGKLTVFQPNGPRFHDVTHVNIATDSQGRILVAELVLARRFVDSSNDGIFARDIAKSFLQIGINPDDMGMVESLVTEINQLKGSRTPVIVHRDAVPPAPAGPASAGYLVYLGERNNFQFKLPHGQVLTITNRPSATPYAGQALGEQELSIQFGSRP